MLHNFLRKLHISDILVNDSIYTFHALLKKHCAIFVRGISCTANSFLRKVFTFVVFVLSTCYHHFTRLHVPTTSVLKPNLYTK